MQETPGGLLCSCEQRYIIIYLLIYPLVLGEIHVPFHLALMSEIRRTALAVS